MSRIQDILRKAEEDGAVRRTRNLASPTPIDWQKSAPSAGQAVMERPAVAAPAPSVARPAAVPPPQPVGLDSRLVAAHAHTSLAAEQYRSLRTRIKSAENGRPLRTIVITSPNKGDGKSLTAANLALTMAQEFQQRVVLVDGDLRRPSVHRLFGVPSTFGLSNILTEGAAVEDALVTVADHGLTILPAGPIPMHPAELLGSAAMRRLIDTLRSSFDRVLIDMPPAAPLADVAIASAMADGILMIVRAGVTKKPAIERALSGLDQTKVLGLVLNDAGDAGAGYYGYDTDGYVAD
jgi:capsular exopolysaccharide synthesis family protein